MPNPPTGFDHGLSLDAAQTIVSMIKRDGEAVVNFTAQVSNEGRAPKNDPAVFVLALAASYGDSDTKKAAYAAIPTVCRIGTHIFQFCDAVNSMRGWSAGLRNGVARFYTGKNDDQVALQLIKYRQRGGWTHKDVLRLSHGKLIVPDRVLIAFQPYPGIRIRLFFAEARRIHWGLASF